ncbi:MAG: hypothetical protein JW902_02615 [Syntrophaceae bacterium]|nr:hypothetical protein [Syntrophaceae bacterium]
MTDATILIGPLSLDSNRGRKVTVHLSGDVNRPLLQCLEALTQLSGLLPPYDRITGLAAARLVEHDSTSRKW